MTQNLWEILDKTLSGLRIVGKAGQSVIQPALVEAINAAGLHADMEDMGAFLNQEMPVWRSKDSGEIEPTRARRKIDIVVRQFNQPIALIEVESDLNDLRPEGVTRRNGHYDVFSIARTASGSHFHSYKSLERMAAAAFYHHLAASGRSELSSAVDRLAEIQSDRLIDHNPEQLALFLVSGSYRPIDEEILKPRLRSVGARLMGLSIR